MALDVGDKMVGVAVSDPTGLIAEPKPPLRRSVLAADLEAIRGLGLQWDISGIVVGWPVNMNGSHGPQVQKVKAFLKSLEKVVPWPIAVWDERLSTVEAERRLIEADVRRKRRRQLVDGVAAAVILQGYLDRHRTTIERSDMMSDKDHHDQFEPDEDEVITLTDDEGKDHDFVVVDVIEVHAKEYAILLPYEAADDEEAEAVILRIEKGPDGEDQLIEIEDQNEWQSVVDTYEAVLDADDEDDK